MSSGKDKVDLSGIDPMVCYHSRIKMLNRLVTNLYDKAFKPFKITGNQVTLLLFIGKTKTTNQKMMAEMLNINFTTVSRDLDKLSTAGWIRINKGQDARVTNVSLSPKGMALLSKVVPVWKKINDSVHEQMGDSISGNLDKMLKTMIAEK